MLRKQKKSNHKTVCIETLISAGVIVEGNIHYRGGIQIDGTVKGNIIADPDIESSLVRVSRSACVTGDLIGPNVIINGKIEGNVICSQHLELAAHATVVGNVHYKLLEMAAGAEVNGSLSHLVEEGLPLDLESEAVDQINVAEMMDDLKQQLNGHDALQKKKA